MKDPVHILVSLIGYENRFLCGGKDGHWRSEFELLQTPSLYFTNITCQECYDEYPLLLLAGVDE